MNNRAQIYHQNIDDLRVKLHHYKKTGAIMVFSKLILVALSLWFGYQWIWQSSQASLLGLVLSVLAFVAVFRYDLRFLKKQQLALKLLETNRNELAALNGDVSAFDDGHRFADATHSYSFDLDLFVPKGIFQTINRTVTHEGRTQLAAMLLKTDVEAEVVLQRQQAIDNLKEWTDWRLRFIAIGSIETLSLAAIVPNFTNKHRVNIKPWMKAVGVALITLAVIGLAGNIIGWWAANVWLIPFLTNLAIVGFWLKQTNHIYGKVNGTFKVVDKYHDLLLHVQSHQHNMDAPLLNEITQILAKDKGNSIAAFSDLKKLLGRFDQRSNILIAVAANGFLLSDLQLLLRYNQWIGKYGHLLPQYQNAIAQLDALVSLANFAYNRPSFCKPVVDGEILLNAHQMGHPLIAESERVNNDFCVDGLHRFFITTGANMAGKSTFLRTAGINLVLAACGAPVCAKSFVFRPIALFSSMRANDNLVSHVSYFQAELLRLQSLIDQAKSGIPMFVILDEILKGTNSKDKLEGSRLFLKKLLQYNLSGIIATHDLALGDLSIEQPSHFSNICFEVDIMEDELYFSYKLQQGVAQNMNATWLLNKMLNR